MRDIIARNRAYEQEIDQLKAEIERLNRRASPPAPVTGNEWTQYIDRARQWFTDNGEPALETEVNDLACLIQSAVDEAMRKPAPAPGNQQPNIPVDAAGMSPLERLVADQQFTPPEFNDVFARRHTEMLADPVTPAPTPEHRERAEAFIGRFRFSTINSTTEPFLASQFAAVADEATKAERDREAEAFLRRTGNGVTLDAEPTPEQLTAARDFIEKHWPGMDVMRGTVWHADACAVVDAATKAERERCAGVCDVVLKKFLEFQGTDKAGNKVYIPFDLQQGAEDIADLIEQAIRGEP